MAGGLVVRHSELHDVHYLNARPAGPDARPGGAPRGRGAADVAAVAERWQGDLGHRHIVFDDAAAGERVAAEREAEGWSAPAPCTWPSPAIRRRSPRPRRAGAISEPEMQALQLAALREEAPEVDARTGLVARLVATQSRLRDDDAVPVLWRRRAWRRAGLDVRALPR